MTIKTFTDEELEHINKDVFDKTQPIYAYSLNNHPFRPLPSPYIIKCNNIPMGLYSIQGNHIQFGNSTMFKIAYNFETNVKNYVFSGDRQSFDFKVTGNCSFDIKIWCVNIKKFVTALREQEILNNHSCQFNQRLIQQCIAKQTDLGEEYNRNSFYNTLNECLHDDIDIEIDPNNSKIDADTISLKSAKLTQDKARITSTLHQLREMKKQYCKQHVKLTEEAKTLNDLNKK